MLNLLSQATQPSGWTPEVIAAVVAGLVALVTAIGAAVAAVIAAMRGTTAQAQATANSASIGRQSDRMNRIESDQKHIALATPVPARPPTPHDPPTTSRPPFPVLLLPLLLAPLFAGCAGPDPAFVAAERATHNAIAEEYQGYYRADANKSDAEKARNDRLLEQWEKDIAAQEAEVKKAGPF